MIRFRPFLSRTTSPRLWAAAACIGASLTAGCASHDGNAPAPDPEEGAHADVQLISAVRDAAVANAIVAQHTLYPYHFVANGGALNDLGERDLAVLAEHYRANPGDLSVRRGDVPTEIYDARVRAVREALERGGVEVARVTIGDQLPGGSGLRSEDVVHIMQMNLRQTGKMYLDSGSSGSSGGAAAGGAGGSGGGGSGGSDFGNSGSSGATGSPTGGGTP